MPRPPLIAFAIAAAYFIALLIVTEVLRRRMRVSPDVTRSLFLMGTGVWVFPAHALFDSGALAAIPFAALAVLTYFSFRFELFVSIEDDGPSLGSVFLPASCAVLLTLLWGDRIAIAIASIQAASFGDAAAALVGRRFGTRRYRATVQARSMEGTLAMFIVSGVVMAPVLVVLGGLDSHQAVAFALIAATVAACVEAVSILGTDNLTVPAAAAATLAMLLRFSQ